MMKKIDEKTVYDGQWLSVRETIYQNKEGKELSWESVHRKRSTVGVVIVATAHAFQTFYPDQTIPPGH